MQVSTHPAPGAAVHVAGGQQAAGPINPAALHGERGDADLHTAGSLRKTVLSGTGVLDRAAHDHARAAQDGAKHGARAALQ